LLPVAQTVGVSETEQLVEELAADAAEMVDAQ